MNFLESLIDVCDVIMTLMSLQAFYDLLFEIFAILMYCLPNISLVYKVGTAPTSKQIIMTGMELQ